MEVWTAAPSVQLRLPLPAKLRLGRFGVQTTGHRVQGSFSLFPSASLPLPHALMQPRATTDLFQHRRNKPHGQTKRANPLTGA
jgi:hypothetical protein